MADSLSCERLARHVLRKNGADEQQLREADIILVVVRSFLLLPLRTGHRSVDELKQDSNLQLNISGGRGHLYVFTLDGNLKPQEVFHSHFEWEPWLDQL